MKWVAIAVAGLAFVAVIVAFVGSRLPQAHVATRMGYIDAPPDAVWEMLTAVDRFPQWRTGVKRVFREPDAAGPAWVEEGSNGRIRFVVERADRPRTLVTRIADRALPFGGSWTFEIRPQGRGSDVTITERGEIYNPIFRFMARFVFGYDATMAAYVADLQKAAPAHAP